MRGGESRSRQTRQRSGAYLSGRTKHASQSAGSMTENALGHRPTRSPLVQEGTPEFEARCQDAMDKVCQKYAWTAQQDGIVLRRKRTQHGKPMARSAMITGRPRGQVGRLGVAERFAVPRKPGNAGGGKGPQFKTDATSGEGFGDWATYELRKLFRNCRRRCTRKRRQKPAIASTRCTTRSAVTTFWPMRLPSAAPTRAHRG